LLVTYLASSDKLYSRKMAMRISIEVTDTQHKILKANAALQGQSLKEYVLERTIPTPDEETALKELEAFMRPSVEAVYRGERSDQTLDEIFDDVIQEDNIR
jgi:hypothetical protein